MNSLPNPSRKRTISWADRLAFVLSLLGVWLSFWLSGVVFERIPHIEDEMAYVWQAKVLARGQLALPSPAYSNAYLVPFVVDYNGLRFGKYPLGWPAALAIGIFLNARSWVNPIFAGLALWLLYRLGKRLFGETVAILAVILTLTSPFFLMNTASLLSHPFGLFLSLTFALSWLDAWPDTQPNPASLPSRLPTIAMLCAALSIGLLAITRPLTAIGIALPYSFHALYLFIFRGRSIRLRLLGFALIAASIAGLLFLWQYAVTGNPFLNPYTLWWPYDKVGFGPGFGRASGGHTWHMAWINLKFSTWVGRHDLFGWGSYSWLLLPMGLIPLITKRRISALPSLLALPSLIFVYLFYWIGSWLFGPRYYFEGLHSATLLSALGIAFLAGWPVHPAESLIRYTGWRKIRPLLVTALFALALAVNMIFYLPLRLGGMHGLYGVTAERLKPFQTEQARQLTPALVIVHPQRWTDYGTLLDLSSPFLDSPFIFIRSVGATVDRQVAEEYPQRTVIEYFTNDPYNFRVIRRAYPR